MKEGITILLVEVYAPAYDKSYDMRVEEQTSIRQLMEEMTVLIGQKEKNIMAGEIEKLCLCNIRQLPVFYIFHGIFCLPRFKGTSNQRHYRT